jgi:hypothetical protein
MKAERKVEENAEREKGGRAKADNKSREQK